MKILVVLGIALAFNTVFLRFYCFVQRKQEQGKSTNLVFRFFRDRKSVV